MKIAICSDVHLEFGQLTLKNTENAEVLILSGDKDFIQLHTYSNVKQYDPTRKKWISHNDPKRYLKEHILKGDKGDGIPNVLSSDNCLVIGDRQRSLTQKKMDTYIELDLDEKKDLSIYRNYMRNKQLIDLTFTPKDIREKVMESYNAQIGRNKSKLINYFIANKLKNLMEHVSEF